MSMNKKGEIEHTFTLLLIAVVTIIIIIFGGTAIVKIMSSVEDVELADFASTFTEDIKRTNAKKGSDVFTYELPSKVKKIMIIDTTNKKALLNNDFVKSQPIIIDAVESDERKNMFLFTATDKLIKSFYIGEVSLGQIGSQVCTGIGVMNVSFSQLKIRITKKTGWPITIGDECNGLKYITFQGPFIDELSGVPHVKIIANDKQITLREDPIRMIDYQTVYFRNGTLNSTVFPINSSQTIDRIFFSTIIPTGTDIKFRIGFKDNVYRDWSFFGPNLTANSASDKGYYYEYPGEYITRPESPVYPYSDVMIQIHFFATNDFLTTPTFNWAKISYYDS